MKKDLGSIDAKRAAELGIRADMDAEPVGQEKTRPPKPAPRRPHLWKIEDKEGDRE